jgi:hypothetical protein
MRANTTACPASLMLLAELLVKPGRPPRSMTLPPLHSVAQSASDHFSDRLDLYMHPAVYGVDLLAATAIRLANAAMSPLSSGSLMSAKALFAH